MHLYKTADAFYYPFQRLEQSFVEIGWKVPTEIAIKNKIANLITAIFLFYIDSNPNYQVYYLWGGLT